MWMSTILTRAVPLFAAFTIVPFATSTTDSVLSQSAIKSSANGVMCVEQPESISHCDNNKKLELSFVDVSSDNNVTHAIVAKVTHGRNEFQMQTALATSLFDDLVSLVPFLFSDLLSADVASAT